MTKNFANKIYNGTSKQTAASGKNFYITAIVGVVDAVNDTPALATVSFDELTNLPIMDDKVASFPYPIMTPDFTPDSQNIFIVYYEGK